MALISTYLRKAWENKDDTIPWGTLRYLIGEAMYGGRVSDSFDRRILKTYLDEYLGDFLFDRFHPFKFFNVANISYNLPIPGPRDSYVEEIESLPLVQTPDVFGLHLNADISYYTITAKMIWMGLVDLQPRGEASQTGGKREDIVDTVASDILEKLPKPFDIPVVRKEIGLPTPVQVVLLQELDRWNKLVLRIQDSLHLLKKALAGEIGMSKELDDLATSLFNGQLPAMWRKLTPQVC